MRRLAPLGALALVLTLTGCSGATTAEPVPVPTHIDLGTVDIENGTENGLWLLTGNDAASQVLSAMRRAEGVTVDGVVHEMIPQQSAPPVPGRVIQFTVSETSSATTAAITAGAVQVEIRIVDGTAYIRGNAAYDAAAGIETGTVFACTSPDSELIAEWANLLDPAQFVSTTLIGFELGVLEPTDAAPDVATVVVGSGGAPLGTLLVESEGQPLPRELRVADQTGSIVATFSGWGEPVSVVAPGDIAPGC